MPSSASSASIPLAAALLNTVASMPVSASDRGATAWFALDAIACVLGAQREEAARTSQLRQSVAQVLQSAQRGEEVQAIEKLSLASFSRRQELEADQIGVATIARAGLDPYGAPRFLESLGRSSAMREQLTGKSSNDPDVMSTHPSTPERVSRAIAAARQIGAPGDHLLNSHERDVDPRSR